MIVGRVDRAYDATIPVDILERGSRLHRLEVPIDTGFEGYLMLPLRIVHQFGMTLERRVTMTLANEQDSVFERYLSEVLWFGRPLTVSVLASENQSLVGKYLLAGTHIEIDMIPGGIVSIDTLAAAR